MNFIEEYYNSRDEEARLLSQHGQVEYLTTMKYIEEYLSSVPDPVICEIGAGTGRYSVTLAKRGYRVTAIELVKHNLEILSSKLDGSEKIETFLANALDLDFLADSKFDLTLVLGPLYHLYTRRDKLKALKNAVRVTKPGGYIFVAYCMNEPTVIQYVFMKNTLREIEEASLLTPDWHCVSEPKEVFELVRTEDIASLDKELPVERIKLVASDGAAHYLKEFIDGMDRETFAKWMDFHFATCERNDLVGASNHTIDILRKNFAD
ncbi:MAG: class I SAM-dependent methyltransferase [Clostridia bacterium]|nr:class I SAM-dependent methyltransferase [Clostridia bacterium]